LLYILAEKEAVTDLFYEMLVAVFNFKNACQPVLVKVHSSKKELCFDFDIKKRDYNLKLTSRRQVENAYTVIK